MLQPMVGRIDTNAREISEQEYLDATVARARPRAMALDFVASILLFLVAAYVIKLDLPVAAALVPSLMVLGWYRLPGRIRKMADHHTSNRPVGPITFTVDEEGVIYASSAVEPTVLKWPEIRSVTLVKGIYFIDAGFEDLLFHPSAFESSIDEQNFQAELRTRGVRTGGF